MQPINWKAVADPEACWDLLYAFPLISPSLPVFSPLHYPNKSRKKNPKKALRPLLSLVQKFQLCQPHMMWHLKQDRTELRSPERAVAFIIEEHFLSHSANKVNISKASLRYQQHLELNVTNSKVKQWNKHLSITWCVFILDLVFH